MFNYVREGLGGGYKHLDLKWLANQILLPLSFVVTFKA